MKLICSIVCPRITYHTPFTSNPHDHASFKKFIINIESRQCQCFSYHWCKRLRDYTRFRTFGEYSYLNILHCYLLMKFNFYLASCPIRTFDKEIKSLDSYIVNTLIPGVTNWDRLFLNDSQITKRWVTSKLEGKGINTTPCRLLKTSEATRSILDLLREFTTNKSIDWNQYRARPQYTRTAIRRKRTDKGLEKIPPKDCESNWGSIRTRYVSTTRPNQSWI